MGNASMHKAQIWSFDFTFAATMLTFLLLMFLISWNDLSIRWNNAENYKEMKIAALSAADSLLTTSGDLKSWQILNLTTQMNQISSVGLADSRSVLNNDKLAALKSYENTSYEDIKERLGLAKYDMNILITDKNTNTTYYEFGMSIAANKESAAIERPSVLNGSVRTFKLTVWSK